MFKTPVVSGIRFLSKMKTNMTYITKTLGSVDIAWPDLRRSSVAGDRESGAIYRTQLTANFNKKTFSRETTQNLERQINDKWKEKTANNPRLYNGTKFRFNGGVVLEEKYVLNVGLTTYKDLCGTNLVTNFKELQELGKTDFGSSQALMSDPVGVGILLVTEDGYLVVTRRASWTGEFPGMLDRPGGHPEPERILTSEGTLKPEFAEANINEVVMDEIWSSAAQEAEDELGINKEKLEGRTFLGLSINNISGGRPSLEFFARLYMKSQDVRELYSLGKQAEADESTALHLIPRETFRLLPKCLLNDLKLDGGIIGGATSVKADSNSFSQNEKGGRADAQNNSTVENDVRLLLQEATPALKAAIMLAHYHHLLD